MDPVAYLVWILVFDEQHDHQTNNVCFSTSYSSNRCNVDLERVIRIINTSSKTVKVVLKT
jgi:hypothetical protein